MREEPASNRFTILHGEHHKISRYIGYFSAKRQDHQWYSMIKCATYFTIILFKNHNKTQQVSHLQMKLEKYTRPYIYNLQLHSPKLWYYINFRVIYSPTIKYFPKCFQYILTKYNPCLINLFSKQEGIEIPEAKNTPSDQRYGKQRKILIDSMANKLILLQEKYDQIFKQPEQ